MAMPSGTGRLKKEKEAKRKKRRKGRPVETDAAVDKISDLQFLSTAAWKSLLAFHTVIMGSCP